MIPAYLDKTKTIRDVAVYGLAKSGLAAIRSLCHTGHTVYAWDDSVHPEGLLEQCDWWPDLKHRCHIIPFAEFPWATLHSLILSPGIPLYFPHPHPVVQQAHHHNCPIIGDIELLYHNTRPSAFIGITGTNGKSTTTALTDHIFTYLNVEHKMGGNIGIAPLALEPLSNTGAYLLEVSSFQLDLCHQVRFHHAALLNITPDHLDRHGDMEEYIRAKERIFLNQTEHDIAIISIDSPLSREIATRFHTLSPARLVQVSTTSYVPGGITIHDHMLRDESKLPALMLPIRSHYLHGQHNLENIAISYAIARQYGLDPHKIIEAIHDFKGLRHRLQWCGHYGGVSYYNDSKATNAEATEKALLSIPYPIYWILGGKPKSGGIEILTPYFDRIRHAFLIGEATEQFAALLDQQKLPYSRCTDLEHAFSHAHLLAQQEQLADAVILLSPACASFDQWANFEERGDAFCALVSRLAPPPSPPKTTDHDIENQYFGPPDPNREDDIDEHDRDLWLY
jgi:UDP-N-acetylmuramoylalanine--D-glutamate ligase